MVLQRKKRKIPRPDPNSLAGKLVYFSGLENDAECHELDQRLLLISEDQHESEPEYNSSYVFGFTINDTEIKTLRDHFRKAGRIAHHSVQRVEVMYAPESFMVIENMNFITERSKDRYPEKTNFGRYSSYPCDELGIAEEFASQLSGQGRRFIASYGTVMIDRELLTELMRLNFAMMRDADPDIVFEESVIRRTMRAFPEEFDFTFGG